MSDDEDDLDDDLDDDDSNLEDSDWLEDSDEDEEDDDIEEYWEDNEEPINGARMKPQTIVSHDFEITSFVGISAPLDADPEALREAALQEFARRMTTNQIEVERFQIFWPGSGGDYTLLKGRKGQTQSGGKVVPKELAWY